MRYSTADSLVWVQADRRYFFCVHIEIHTKIYSDQCSLFVCVSLCMFQNIYK